MRKLLIILSIFSPALAYTQQVQFSQYYSASLYLSPAFAGIYEEMSFHASYRTQIARQGGLVNNLSQASLIMPLYWSELDRTTGGVGLMAYNQTAGLEGLLQTNGLFLTYAHNLYVGSLEGETILVGAQVGFEQTGLSFSKLSWGSQYSPFIGFDETQIGPVTEFDQQIGYPLVNFGAMYYFNKQRNFVLYKYSAFSGFVITNLNRPNTTFVSGGGTERPPLLYKYHGGLELKFENFDFLPTLLGTYQNRNFQFNGGGTVAYSLEKVKKRYTVDNRGGLKLVGGAWYRLRDSFIFLAGLRSPSLNVGISYDLNTKAFFNDGQLFEVRPSFEVSVQYFAYKKHDGPKSGNPLF